MPSADVCCLVSPGAAFLFDSNTTVLFDHTRLAMEVAMPSAESLWDGETKAWVSQMVASIRIESCEEFWDLCKSCTSSRRADVSKPLSQERHPYATRTPPDCRFFASLRAFAST